MKQNEYESPEIMVISIEPDKSLMDEELEDGDGTPGASVGTEHMQL